MIKTLTTFLALLMLSLAVAETANAQILDRVRQRVQREAERRVEDRMVRAAIRAMDATEDAIVCMATDRDCIQSARDDGAELIIVDEEGEPISYENDPRAPAQPAPATPGAQAGPAPAVPGEGVWANYDFVPGDRPLFIEDFSTDRIGNFPRRLNFGEGNMDVVQWEGRTFLRATARSAFTIPLSAPLPERFTIEFDAYSGEHEWIAVMTSVPSRPLQYSGYPGSYLVIKNNAVDLDGDGPSVSSHTNALQERITPFRIAVDGSYIKAYADEHRVVNVPNANIVRGDAIHVIVWYARDDRPTYLTNIRVLAGGDDLYDRLTTEGRVATQGILFATGSAIIQPESTPTLRDIARVVQQNPSLRLRIEGHTDNVGAADANLRLSEQRAQAVVDYLVQRAGIAADRLEAAGMGQDHPVADNATAEGRQENRRVELVVID